MRSTTAALLALAACVCFQLSYVAYADGIRIDVRRLDWSKPGVASRVYARIERSAWLVCRDNSSPWDSARVNTLQRCASAAIDDAVRRANTPELTALHRSHKARSDLASYPRRAGRSQ